MVLMVVAEESAVTTATTTPVAYHHQCTTAVGGFPWRQWLSALSSVTTRAHRTHRHTIRHHTPPYIAVAEYCWCFSALIDSRQCLVCYTGNKDLNFLFLFIIAFDIQSHFVAPILAAHLSTEMLAFEQQLPFSSVSNTFFLICLSCCCRQLLSASY